MQKIIAKTVLMADGRLSITTTKNPDDKSNRSERLEVHAHFLMEGLRVQSFLRRIESLVNEYAS